MFIDVPFVFLRFRPFASKTAKRATLLRFILISERSYELKMAKRSQKRTAELKEECSKKRARNATTTPRRALGSRSNRSQTIEADMKEHCSKKAPTREPDKSRQRRRALGSKSNRSQTIEADMKEHCSKKAPKREPEKPRQRRGELLEAGAIAARKQKQK